MTRRPFLRVTKSIGYTDESVTRIEIDAGVSAGIRWGSLSSEMVPIFEEQAARLERGFSQEAWLALDPIERALIIAIRRIDNAMKNIQAEAEIREAKKKGNNK